MRWWFRKRVSTIEALRALFGKSRVYELTLRTTDRREIFESMATLVGSSPLDIARAVAQKLRLPVIESIPPSSIPNELRSSETLAVRERLLRAGACPVTNGGITLGYACVDPHVFWLLLPEYKSTPLFLSPWSAILTAWGNADTPQSKDDEKSSTHLGAFLDSMRALLETHEAQALRVDFAAGGFQCIRDERRIVEGTLHASVCSSLQREIEYLAKGGESSFVSDSSGVWSVNWEENSLTVTFTVYRSEKVVPLRTERTTESSTAASRTPEEKEGHDVLIVDDNETFSGVVERYLSKHGMRVIRAKHGGEALAYLEGENPLPWVILTDLHMPQVNGFELIARVHAQHTLRSIPIIVLTSDEDREAELSLISKGVEVLIRKNEDPRLLCSHIRRVVERERKRAA